MARLHLAEDKVALLFLLVWLARADGRRSHSRVSSARPSLIGGTRPRVYFPMQNVLKIKLRMSSVVVAPVMASSGRSALQRSSSSISCGTLPATALFA